MSTPVNVEQFRGLRLNAEQGEAAGAISTLNADLTRGFSQVGTRGGMSRLVTGTASYHRIAPCQNGATKSLVLFRNTGSAVAVEKVNVATGIISLTYTALSATAKVTSVVTDTGANGPVYITSRDGTANGAIQFYDPITGPLTTSATAMRYLAVTPGDLRWVAAHYTSAALSPTGANGSPSTVFFSDPSTGTSVGSTFSFGATNWLNLDANDGDEITGIATWRDYTCIIKRSAIYFFTTPSIDSTGNPIFNFRKVNLPARARATATGGGENIIAGGDGIYLLLSDGVYRTTGDVPQLVSRDISPLFDGTGDSTMLFPSSGDWTIGYAANRVYLSYTVGSTYRTLVYDTILGEWLLWDVSAGASAAPTNVVEWVDTNGLPTAYVAAGAKVWSFTRTATSDDGTAIVSSYQSGFDGLGYPSQEKKVRNVELVGVGAPTMTVLTDYATTDPLSRQGTVTLGTAPAVAGAVHAKAYTGRLFSYKLSATSGLWTLGRLTWNVQSVRPPGLRSA